MNIAYAFVRFHVLSILDNNRFLNFDSPFRNMHIAYSLLIKRLHEVRFDLSISSYPTSCSEKTGNRVPASTSTTVTRWIVPRRVFLPHQHLISTGVSWCVGTILNDSERDLLSNFPDQISVTTLPASKTLWYRLSHHDDPLVLLFPFVTCCPMVLEPKRGM